MDADSLASPDLYPLAFDPATEQTRFVTLDEAGYRAASFLHERILAEAEAGYWVPWRDLWQASERLSGECDFIFHIGHVGSTLLSRLLDGSERVFSLREPAVLRTLAQAELDLDDRGRLEEWAGVFLKLWARVYHPGRKTLLKATSFTSEIAPMLMGLNPSASAILMFVSPSIYLAGIMAGDASREESRINAPMRLTRLHRRLGREAWRLGDLSEGEAAAMSWLCEITALAKTADAFPARVLWLDFEAFLARPAEGLAAALQRLHGEAPQADIAAMMRSPDLTRYSKAPEFGYDANLRRRVLAQAGAQHGAEIARGMAWLNASGGAYPVLGGAMRQVAAAARAG